MQRLSANVPEARTFIEAALLRPIDNNGESSSSGLKRKAAEECENCKEYYQIDDDTKKVADIIPVSCRRLCFASSILVAFAYITFSPW